MDKATAISQIDSELRDSGNANYTFDTARPYLETGYAEAVRAGDEFVFVKPPSGYEVEIPTAVVKAAFGR